MNWCMDKYKCLLSFRGSQDKKLSSMSRAFPHSANGQKDMFILCKCIPPLLEPCLELKEARVPLGSTSKRASGGLCSTRALGGSGERLWKRPESGSDATKLPDHSPLPGPTGVMESCWHLTALPVASAKRTGRGLVLGGPNSTSQLALIGPLAGLPVPSVRLAMRIELRWGRECGRPELTPPFEKQKSASSTYFVCLFFNFILFLNFT